MELGRRTEKPFLEENEWICSEENEVGKDIELRV
jgi:hypothetical protein